jgi:hypothetical protein
MVTILLTSAVLTTYISTGQKGSEAAQVGKLVHFSSPSRPQKHPKILIANAGLEFALTPCKINQMHFSNRKWIAFSRFILKSRRPRSLDSGSHSGSTHHLSLITHHCISNRDTGIRISPNSRDSNTYAISNRDTSGSFHFRKTNALRSTAPSLRPRVAFVFPPAYTGVSSEGELLWKILSF